MPDEFDVFLSHNSRDKPAVEEIATYLRPARLAGQKQAAAGRLEAMTWVDLRRGLTDDGLARLVWGITGTKEPV